MFKTLISNDLFYISKRIKEIDGGYFLLFNQKTKKIEVHNKFNKSKNTYCLTCPFSCLDERLLTLIRKTRTEREEQLLKEIECENKRLRLSQAKKEAEEGAEHLSKALSDVFY